PHSVRLGEVAVSAVELTNHSKRPLRGLVRDAWPPSAGAGRNRHRVRVLPGRRTRVRTALRPTRRGDRHAAAVTIRAIGPLGFAGRQKSLAAPGRLRVLPAFTSRRHLPSRLARLRELDGRAAVQVRGEGTEFDSLREYVIGDDVRAIDWRASARRAEVVVRTWRPERDRRVFIVIDSSRLSAARLEDAPRLEAQIEAALLLSALAERAGDRVELVAIDSEVRARVTGVQGPRLMSTIAESLSQVEPALVEMNWPLVAATVRQALSQRALLVILSPVEPWAVVDGLLPVLGSLTRDHQVVVASASDPETEAIRQERDTGEEIYDAAAAERAELERAAVAGLLQRAGAHVVQAPPGELPPALADAYLELKAAGKL
ncbi:MAG TPA: DUF58 domain-containing protein, partial [Actinomycetaceae bacterium]|nr:DUF58 domain-containing protein [Actinomycetaceae bacterium]